MLIDWFTVGAQIVNFLILIYLLKRFLYKPILRAMDEREQKIANRLREAEEKRQKAESEARSLAEERRQLENNRKKMLAEAKEEIEKWREEALERAREEVEKTRSTWQDNLERDKDDFIRKVKTTLSRQVFRVASKALRDLTDDRLEGRLVDSFKRLAAEAVEKKDQADAELGDRLQVKSGFELSDRQQEDVRTAVREVSPEAEVSFMVAPEVGYGIQLIGNSRKFEWSLSRYMGEMEESILGLMHLTRGGKK